MPHSYTDAPAYCENRLFCDLPTKAFNLCVNTSNQWMLWRPSLHHTTPQQLKWRIEKMRMTNDMLPMSLCAYSASSVMPNHRKSLWILLLLLQMTGKAICSSHSSSLIMHSCREVCFSHSSVSWLGLNGVWIFAGWKPAKANECKQIPRQRP